MLAMMMANKLKKSVVRSRSVWAVSNVNSDDSSDLSCDEMYFAANEKIELSDEHINDLANI